MTPRWHAFLAAFLLLSGAACGGEVAGPPPNPDAATSNLQDDCTKLCRRENENAYCLSVFSCDGGCPNTCMERCLNVVLPAGSPACDSAWELYIRCLANSVPFYGCMDGGVPLPTHCEAQLATTVGCYE